MRSETWKDVTLPPLDEWQGIKYFSITPEGAIIIDTDDQHTLTIDLAPLRPGVTNRLCASLTAIPTEGNTAEIRFAEKSMTLPAGDHIDLILESELILDPILHITGVEAVTINSLRLQILFPDRSKPVPYDLIGFEVLMPNIPQGFVVNRDKIGRAPLGGMSAIAGSFIIGESRLDVDRLPIPLPEYSWKDILGPGLSLSFRQGANAGSSLLPVAQVGSAVIEIKDFDPRETFLRQGLKCRIYHRITRQIIFTGTLKIFTMKPAKYPDEHDVATLEFVDTVAKLAATKRYGARSPQPETLEKRLGRLLQGTGIDWNVLDHPPAVTNSLGPAVTEANLAEYLDMTCATVGGAWWVNHDGSITVNPNTDVQVFHQVPWFIIGKTPLDGAKLPPEGADLLVAADQETGDQVENPFTIGESCLDQARIATIAQDPTIEKGFIIGKSRLDGATLSTWQSNTGWAISQPDQPPLLTDRHTDDPRALDYIDIEPGFSSAEMLTEVGVENHTAQNDETGWHDATKTFVATNHEAAARFGTERKTIKAFAATDMQAQNLAEYLLNRPVIADRSAFAITSAQFNALPISETLTRLTLFSYCQLMFKNARSDHLVYAMEHQLTPYTWKERLYLQAAREERIEI